MGSFNATCVISGLPIEAGDPVRFLALTENEFYNSNEHICYVTGRFQPRTAPVRAKYNDYGSVEEIEKSLTERVFFKSFNVDVIEKGVGDNQCHDVHVRKGMNQKEWLEALWEGRVFVNDGHQWPKLEGEKLDKIMKQQDDGRPQGYPTLSRIEKVLKDADFPVVVDYGAKGFLIDVVTDGFIRVRESGFSAKKKTSLEKVLTAIQDADYAAMITCGTGNYSGEAEILIAPKPRLVTNDQKQTYNLRAEGFSRDKQSKERPVAAVMIREDVWQILLSTTLKDWVGRGELTIDLLKGTARKTLAEDREWEEQLKTEPDNAEKSRKQLQRTFERDRDYQNRFLGSLRGAEGVSGFYLKEAYELGAKLAKTDAELDAFLDDMAEMVFVQWVYTSLHGQWHPTTNSGQDGNWESHRAFLTSLLAIKGKYEDEEFADSTCGS
jgi:hypothetical protein